jgi:hypothetical protein
MRIEKILNYWIVILLVLMGCNSTIQPDIALDSLLIDLSAMPPDWYIASTNNRAFEEDFNYERTADISLTNPTYLGGGHAVFQFRSERQAARIFERQLRREFNSSSVASETPWQIPPELPYTSEVADQFHFACHISNINGLSEICKMMGQYDNYLVILSIHMTPDYMTYADLEKVLEAVDKKMADALAEGVK